MTEPIESLDDFSRGEETEPSNSGTRTLGDLLYGNNEKFRVPEKDWVALIRAISVGDQVALHSLYERTHRIVFTLIARITNNPETAEELTVDVFYDVWRKASSYDPRNGSVVGWIMNQARSRAIDRFRFEHRKKRVKAYVETPLITTASNDPHEACELEEQGRLLRATLELLTPEERQAIETAFFLELTYEEVATRLNQPIGTIKTLPSRISGAPPKRNSGCGSSNLRLCGMPPAGRGAWSGCGVLYLLAD